MTSPVDRTWLVEDDTALQRLATLEPDASGVRLDVPGWRRTAQAGPRPVGLVVGRGTRITDLAVAVADLADAGPVRLLLPPDGVADVTWFEAVGGWRVDGEPDAAADAVSVTLRRDGQGPPAALLPGLLRRARSERRQPGPWRVHLADETARAWFGALVDSPERFEVSVGEEAAGTLRLATEGASLEVTDDPLAATESVRLVARPVDLRRFTPTGSAVRSANRAPVLPVAAGGRPDGVAEARRSASEIVTKLDHEAAGAEELAIPRDGLPGPTALLLLRRAVAVLDHPALHAGPGLHARWLLACVASGVPVLLLAPLPDVVAQLLGTELAGALADATVDELADPDLRERRAVLQRRPVWAGHTPRARLAGFAGDLRLLPPPPRSVTTVLSTNRDDFLPLGLSQLGRQTWPRLQVVVVTNGDRPPPDLPALLEEHLPDREVIHRHVEARWSLGDALNVGIEVADGDVITKFDDDDWYSPAHVDDLVAALEYSGAEIVGKAAEFVHLAASGKTVRRWGTGGERPSVTLAGGSLAFPRSVWRDLSGFPRVSVGEDQGLIRDVVDAGGTAYRMHPYGYLLHRHGKHAWEVEDTAFLEAAVAVRDGRDHDWTLT